MRIAVLATNRNCLARPYAGGMESITAELVTGFRARGHYVALHAAAGTPDTLADELFTYPPLPPLSEVALRDAQIPEAWFLADHHAFTASCAMLAARSDLDVIANHTLHHLPMSLSGALPAPVVTTLHTPPFPWMELGAALAAPTARYVAVSRALAAQWTTLREVAVVPNGVDPSVWPLGPGSPDGDLVWVGRLAPEKAPHRAVQVARRLGRRLVLVGPPSDQGYVRRVMEPLLDERVTMAGHLDRRELARVVGASAVALVTPDWDEPFGLVCVEQALCGTPVVALGRGGVSEAVADGAGVVVPDHSDAVDADRLEALAAAVTVAERLDRALVRRAAAEAAGLDACVEAHLAVLRAASAGSDPTG